MTLISILVFLIKLYVAVAQDINRDDFDKSIEECGFELRYRATLYYLFDYEIRHYSMCREEQAIFLAQLISSSDGFTKFSKVDCSKKPYYGRGIIKLVGKDQYEAASKYLNLDDYLQSNPMSVAVDAQIAMATSAWYWHNYVRQELYPINVVCGLEPFKFGVTTKAIVARLDPTMCNGQPNEEAKKRYECYLKIANITNIQDKALEEGCYN